MAEIARNDRHYTYGECAAWAHDERWELIGGVAYDMTPAPTVIHQAVVGNLFVAISNLLKGHSCRVFVSPIDILLPEADEPDEDVDTVLQPDVVVVCKLEIIREKNIRSAPDWIIEVLSPTTAKKDEGVKRDCYQRAGVKEYWLVHPTDRTVMRYRLREGAYGLPDVFGEDDRLNLPIPQGAEIELANVFSTEFPPVQA